MGFLSTPNIDIVTAAETVIYVTAILSFIMLICFIIYEVIRFMRRDPLQVRYGDEKKKTKRGIVIFIVLLISTLLTSSYVFLYM